MVTARGSAARPSVVFLVMWTALLLVFYALGWDIGPGVGMRLG